MNTKKIFFSNAGPSYPEGSFQFNTNRLCHSIVYDTEDNLNSHLLKIYRDIKSLTAMMRNENEEKFKVKFEKF